jgi:NAD-dependent dihydropyrimidine dehydrogenase PreA subunit
VVRVTGGDRLGIRAETEHVPLHVLNAIKVAMEIGIDTLRISTVRSNGSQIDESFDVVAQILGALVFHSEDAHRLVTSAECTCASKCSMCSATVTVNVRNTLPVDTPTDEKGRRPILAVTHRHVVADKAAPSIVPFSPSRLADIPITLLGPSQCLNVTCVVKKCNALANGSVWRAVRDRIAIRDHIDITVNRDIEQDYTVETRQAIVASCPQNVFEWDAARSHIVAARPLDCSRCGQCERIARESARPDIRKAIAALSTLPTPPPSSVRPHRTHIDVTSSERYITIGRLPGRRELRVECNGSLPPKDTLLAGIRYLDNELASIASSMRDIVRAVNSSTLRSVAAP